MRTAIAPTPLTAAIARRRGTAVAALLAGDALVHAAWATGLTWPAETAKGLSYAVLNSDVPFTPPVLLPLCVLLSTAAAGVYAHSRRLGRSTRARRAARLVTAAVAGGLTVRALAGVTWIAGIGAEMDTPFYCLNLLLYTPLCAVFGYAAIRLAATPGGDTVPAPAPAPADNRSDSSPTRRAGAVGG